MNRDREEAERILRVFVAADASFDVAREALDALLASGAVVLASDLEQVVELLDALTRFDLKQFQHIEALDGGFCRGCGAPEWPCPTGRAYQWLEAHVKRDTQETPSAWPVPTADGYADGFGEARP